MSLREESDVSVFESWASWFCRFYNILGDSDSFFVGERKCLVDHENFYVLEVK